MSRLAIRIQNRYWLKGRNDMLRCFDVWRKGIIARIKIEKTRARTPPSLLGIECKIA